MEPEENLAEKIDSKVDTKEELVDVLHNKTKLQSLRTYQGDVASFIHDKDKSVGQIAIENRKKAEEKRVEKEEKAEEAEPGKTSSPSFLISTLGIFLLVGSLAIGSYLIYLHYKLAPVELNLPANSILRYDKVISLGNATLGDIVSEAKLDPKYNKGITNIGVEASSTDLIKKLGLHMPPALTRSLLNQYMLGLYGDGSKSQLFIILKENDYGIAFRDMLAWEESMPADFSSILGFTDYSGYMFKDLIVKNKDTRAFSSKFGNVSLIYTFLNEGTVLITESPAAVTALVSAFANGSVIR